MTEATRRAVYHVPVFAPRSRFDTFRETRHTTPLAANDGHRKRSVR